MGQIRQYVAFFCTLLLVTQLRASGNDAVTLSLGIPLQPSSALVHLAVSHDLIQQKSKSNIGLNYFVSGRKAIDGVRAGHAFDILFAADIAFLSNANLLRDYRIVAMIFESDNVNRVVSLGNSTDALKHGTLCTQKDSAVHFFGSMVLDRLNLKDTLIQFYPLADLIDQLGKGNCDAITLRSPYIDAAQQEYDVAIMEMPGAYIQREIMLAHDRVSDEVIRDVIAALLTAEELLRSNTDDSVKRIAKAIDADLKEVTKLLEVSDTRVELKQIMLPMIELQMSWIENNNPSYDSHRQSIQLLRDKPLKTYFPERSSVVRYD